MSIFVRGFSSIMFTNIQGKMYKKTPYNIIVSRKPQPQHSFNSMQLIGLETQLKTCFSNSFLKNASIYTRSQLDYGKLLRFKSSP